MHYRERRIASIVFILEVIFIIIEAYFQRRSFVPQTFEIAAFSISIAMVLVVLIFQSRRLSHISDLVHGMVVYGFGFIVFLFYVASSGQTVMLPLALFVILAEATTYKSKSLNVYILAMGLFVMITVIVLSGIGVAEQSFSIVAYVFIAVVFIVASLLSIRMLNQDEFNARVAKEQEKTLDDILHLVEMKCDEANYATEAKTSFLANMSHEIRTPINAVLGMNEMILREANNADIESYAQNVQRAGNTLLSLINDILDFSKIESGRMEVMPENYELNRLIYDLILVVSPKMEEKELEFIFDFDENMPNELYGDEVRIRQVITNLLTNAAKYTLEGSVTFSVGFEKGNSSNEIMLKISVKDTGIGIKESKEEILSSFKRADDLKAHHIEGTGLGLSITQQLLRLMDSELEMTSVYGEGSDFYFSLPQKVVGEGKLGDINEMFAKQNEIKQEYTQSFIAPEAKILVVDDNSMNRDVIKALLKETQVQIYTAADGKQALNICSREKFDLILMDHLMPVMDGMEAFKLLREDEEGLNATTKTIILTANAVAGMKQGYLKAGFDGFLSKPVEGTLLEQTLIKFLPESIVSLVEKETKDEALEESLIKQVKSYMDPLEISEIDFDDAVKYSAGRVTDAIDNIAGYVKESANVRKRLISECENDNISDFTIHVHALKSNSRIIGAVHMAYLCERMEKAGRESNIAYIKDALEGLIGEFDELIVKLKRLLSVPDVDAMLPKADEEVIDRDFYTEKVRVYIEAVDNYDVDFEGLRVFADTYPEGNVLTEERKALAKSVDDFDYDGMRKALTDILEIME